MIGIIERMTPLLLGFILGLLSAWKIYTGGGDDE